MTRLRAISLTFLAGTILFAPQDGYRAEQDKPDSAPSLTELEVPNESEKKQIRDLIDQIARVEASISTMKDDLEVLGRVKDEVTVIYLRAEYRGEPGNQDRRFFVNEMVTVKWNGDKPGSFEFFRRQARIRGVYVIRKTMKADSMTEAATQDALTVPISITVQETLDSGRGQLTQFRIPAAGEAAVQDHKELVQSGNAAGQEAVVIYLRKVEDRLGVLRNYLQFLKDTERMMRYLIRNKLESDQNRYERTESLP